ncbi:MAG: hypothetical protein ABIN36_07110 [Ferruginibacter sp.]
MANDKRYTWTVSVIALIDKDDKENGPIIEAAYSEFEESITFVKNPNKDIKFVIYKYDLKQEKATIIKSRVNRNKYVLEIKEEHDLPYTAFYNPPYDHLVNFFAAHVSKKQIEDNEDHKHFFIVWGHAGGLGFMRSSIKNLLNNEVPKDSRELALVENEMDKKVDEIFVANHLISQLSLKRNVQFDRPDFINAPEKNIAANLLNNRQIVQRSNFSKIISAAEMAEIIKQGLAEDHFSTTPIIDNIKTGQKIHTMLCLSCYVDMIETMNALKDIVDVYIAPQTMITFFGYNYKKLFKLLSKTPGALPKEIVTNITNYYLTKFIEPPVAKMVQKDDTIGIIDYKRSVSFSGMHLSICNDLLKSIQSFVVFIEDLGKEITPDKLIPILKNARASCRATSIEGNMDTGIIDYENFVTEFFLRIDPGIRNRAKIRRFYYPGKHISEYYPGNLGSSLFVDDDLGKNFESQSPGSFSIFLPDLKVQDIERELLQMYSDMTNISNNFVLFTRWDKIIKMVLTQ